MNKEELSNLEGCIVSEAEVEEAKKIEGVELGGCKVVDMSYNSFTDYQKENMKRFEGTREYTNYWFIYSIWDEGEEIPVTIDVYVPTGR